MPASGQTDEAETHEGEGRRLRDRSVVRAAAGDPVDQVVGALARRAQIAEEKRDRLARFARTAVSRVSGVVVDLPVERAVRVEVEIDRIARAEHGSRITKAIAARRVGTAEAEHFEGRHEAG